MLRFLRSIVPHARRLSGAAFLAFLSAAPFHAADTDDIGALIEGEQRAYQEWLDEESELPPALQVPDENAVLLFSESLENRAAALCENLEFDTLLEGARTVNRHEHSIDLRIARVRESFSDGCLVRPGDALVAVGMGWRQSVHLTDFAVRPQKALCRQDSPYRLVARYEDPLPGEPLFFSSDPEMREGTFPFQPLAASSPTAPSDAVRVLLRESVPFLSEYEIASYPVGAPNLEALLVLTRRRVTSDDDGLPNHMVVAYHDRQIEVLAQEAVDMSAGTGRVAVTALLDYNGDGFTDILMEGVQKGCPYRALFDGTEAGFQAADFPNLACSC